MKERILNLVSFIFLIVCCCLNIMGFLFKWMGDLFLICESRIDRMMGKLLFTPGERIALGSFPPFVRKTKRERKHDAN